MEAVAPGRRGDIDGLRAVAVLAVLAFHAAPRWLPGGFAGVDVFFVISGFLISRIIVGESFRFATFYARRLRRIVPALVVVLIACLVAGWVLLLADEYGGLGKHVAGGAGFVANLMLWDEVGYFDGLAATKPLLHLWSLGIEEQFYLVWPLLLWLGRRRGLSITIALLVLSFGAEVVVPSFYAPWTRLWELLIGATLAQRPDGRDSSVRCAAGLAAIVASFAIPMHGPWAIVPTAGAALVISAGEGTWLARRVLARPVATWLGRISYPLYLWHWPILVFVRIVDGGPPPAMHRAIAIAASIMLAAATHRLVERPIQRARRSLVIPLVAALFATGGAGLWVFADRGVPSRGVQRGAPDFVAFAFGSNPACFAAHPFAREGSCYESPARHAEVLLVLGDSHGDALGPGLIHAPRDMDLTIITRVGCMPFLGVEYVDRAGKTPLHCRELFAAALAQAVADRRVTTVVLVARHALHVALSGFGEEPTGDLGHFELADGTRDPAEVFRRSLLATVALLEARGIRVGFVDQVPELGFDPRECVERPSGPGRSEAACGLPLADVLARQRAYRAIVEHALPATVFRVDPLPLFCRDGWCSAWRDGAMLYHDDDHLSPRGADVVARAILARLR